MRLRAAVAAIVLTLPVSCGGGSDAATEEAKLAAGPEAPAPTATTEATVTTEAAATTEASGGYTGLLANTYDVSYDICRHDGPVKIAEEFGVSADEESAALAYSKISTEDHEQAAFEGCFRGFLDR